jgi:hypothetical protein
MHTPQEKICTKCGLSKSLESFCSYKRNKDGLNGRCRTCAAASHAAKREHHLQKMAERYQKNRLEVLEERKAYREPRREEARLYQVAYRTKFPDKYKAGNKRWRMAHPHERRLIEQNREARKRGLPHTWTTPEQAFMLNYWHNACAVCGNSEGLFWIVADDHWIPLAASNCPGTVATNMIPLCHGNGGCNNSKHKNEPHIWLMRRFGAKKTAKIEQAIDTYFRIVRETFQKKEAS